MIAKRLLLLVALLVFAGCASQTYDEPIDVTFHFDPDGEYGTYKTWDFLKTNAATTPAFEDAEFRLELADMITEAMTARGLTYVFESPDLQVGYHVASEGTTEEQLQEWWSDHDWKLTSYRLDSSTWRKGTLLLFVFDAKSGKMLWRASAEAVVDADTPVEKRREIARKAIAKILNEMPARKAQ
jgi:hypothetical protein